MYRLSIITTIILSLLLPPLIAVGLSGNDPLLYLNFPFITPPAIHEPFSWGMWWFMVMLVFFVALPFCLIAFRQPIDNTHNKYLFPRWGIVAIILLIICWLLAWNRFEWFASLQLYTFTPLWLCYIVIVNAITTSRKGNCLLTTQPDYLLKLFLLSALFWWYYEYLNGFIHNWYYVNIETLSTTEYVFHSTIAYATVLPAVISTIECLATFSRMDHPFAKLWPLKIATPKVAALISWLVGCVVLAMAALWPEQLFTFVWIAPLFIIVGVRYIMKDTTLFSALEHGDFRPVILSAVAALVCGFFWELWNVKSFAHWEYNIPYVDAYLVFEMPIIGYAGYLPFGLVCIAVAGVIPGTDRLFRSDQS